jgi:catechol 2,3-dioxygenase-like lactoylglutathione lyase family enzyme
MPLHSLDHVNIRTKNLDALATWYEQVLGLTLGERPNAAVDGRWLYLGDKPIVHLVDADQVDEVHHPALEHFALSASGLEAFLAQMDATGTPYRLAEIAQIGTVQVNIADSDGNHIHVDFPLSELKPS